MKATYVIHPHEGYVESQYEESVTLSELGAFIEKIWSDPAWKPELNGLLDFSKASIDLTDAEIETLVKSMEEDPRCSFARFAFVVRTAADFGRLRKVDAQTNTASTLRIFWSKSDAEKWLAETPKKH